MRVAALVLAGALLQVATPPPAGLRAPSVLVERIGGRASKPVKEALGDRLVDSWKYETVKKSTPGAVPALIVSGGGAGQVEWVKPAEGASQPAARPKGTDGKPVPLPLADRHKQLQKRRDALVLKRVQEWLADYSDAEATKRAMLPGQQAQPNQGLRWC